LSESVGKRGVDCEAWGVTALPVGGRKVAPAASVVGEVAGGGQLEAGAEAPASAGWERTGVQRDQVAVEAPLQIRVHDEPLLTTMRTPGSDRELALGLLFCEGLIQSRADLSSLAPCGRPGDEGYGNVLAVVPAPGHPLHAEDWENSHRGSLTTSACGVCGRRSIEDLLERLRPVQAPREVAAGTLARLVSGLKAHQPLFAATGGLHAAGLARAEGDYLWVYEDIGRHNAVDKVIGHAVLEQCVPLTDRVLVVSGRSSFEIVQKAASAGIGMVVSVSAPSSLAVELAERLGMVLIGFATGARFKVYAGRSVLRG